MQQDLPSVPAWDQRWEKRCCSGPVPGNAAGLGWSADVRGVRSTVTGTGCCGTGGTAQGTQTRTRPRSEPGLGTWVCPQGCCPLARGAGSTPGRALCCHRCPQAVPCSPAQGCPVAGARPVLLSTKRSVCCTDSKRAAKIHESAITPTWQP